MLETSHLRLRRWDLADAAFAFRTIYSDPEVMRFIGYRKPHQTIDETRKRIERMIAHYERHSYGLRAVIEKATGLLIGSCGLKHIEDGPEIEVGYHFARSAWGRGLRHGICLRLSALRVRDTQTRTHPRPGRSGQPRLPPRAGEDRHDLRTDGTVLQCRPDGVSEEPARIISP